MSPNLFLYTLMQEQNVANLTVLSCLVNIYKSFVTLLISYELIDGILWSQ